MQNIHNISTRERRQTCPGADSKQMMARTWDRPVCLWGSRGPARLTRQGPGDTVRSGPQATDAGGREARGVPAICVPRAGPGGSRIQGTTGAGVTNVQGFACIVTFSRKFPRAWAKALVACPRISHAMAHNFGPTFLNLAGDYSREPFFIGPEECSVISSKNIVAVRCH